MHRALPLFGCLLLAGLVAPGCGDEDEPASSYRGPAGGYGSTTGYGDGTGTAPPGVGSMGTGYSDAGDEPDGPLPVVADPDAARVERLLSIDGNASTRLIEQGPLTVEGYSSVQITDTGLPREGSVPSFRWTDGETARTWPHAEVVSVPADGATWLVAFMDLNGTGRLDTGDRVGLPAEPLADDSADAPTETLALRVDRIFVSIEPAGGGGYSRGPDGPGDDDDDDGRDAPPRAPGSPDGPDGVPDEDEDPPRAVTIEASGESVSQETLGALILMGFEGKDVDKFGLPRPGARGVWSFTRPRGSIAWPTVVQVRLPQHGDLWVIPVLDLDGDHLLGPGDWLGVPGARFNPPGDRREPIMFGIDRSFESTDYEPDVTFAADIPLPPSMAPRDAAPRGEGAPPNELPAAGCGS